MKRIVCVMVLVCLVGMGGCGSTGATSSVQKAIAEYLRKPETQAEIAKLVQEKVPAAIEAVADMLDGGAEEEKAEEERR